MRCLPLQIFRLLSHSFLDLSPALTQLYMDSLASCATSARDVYRVGIILDNSTPAFGREVCFLFLFLTISRFVCAHSTAQILVLFGMRVRQDDIQQEQCSPVCDVLNRRSVQRPRSHCSRKMAHRNQGCRCHHRCFDL